MRMLGWSICMKIRSSDIVIYTCHTGEKDTPVQQPDHGDTKFVRFNDAYDKFIDPRRNSRIQKMLPHRYMDTKYSIYIDANMKLTGDPVNMIETFLADHDIAIYKHPKRDCLYEEARVIAVKKLDDPETIIEQVKWYEDHGFAKHKGLGENGIIFRRHTPDVERFNTYWWAEYCAGSRRDQLSFMYAADRAGVPVKIIDELWYIISRTKAAKNGFEIFSHANQS